MGPRVRKRGVILLACVLLVTIAAGDSLYRVRIARRPVTQTEFIMGTLISITAYGPNAGRAIEAAFERVREIEKATATTGNSEIARLNAAAGRKWVELGPDSWRILSKSIRYWRATGGAFDVTVGPLVEAWGFQYGGNGRLPAPSEIAEAKKWVGSNGVLLSGDSHAARLTHEGMAVDLGGVAKGYAVEEASKTLKRFGVSNALINGGQSSIKALGSGPGGHGWRIGIGDPRSAQKVLGIVTLQDGQAIGTSSDSQRFFMANGKRYSHLIDPRTGYPARNVSLATVITPNAADADILSTALFINGVEWSKAYAAGHPGVIALFVDPKGNIEYTPGLQFQSEPNSSQF